MTAQSTALSQHVENALFSNPHFAARQLQFEDAAGRIVLKGTVTSYFHKQMAQETIRRIDGVHEIENQLEVAWS